MTPEGWARQTGLVTPDDLTVPAGAHTLDVDGRTYWPVACSQHSQHSPRGFLPPGLSIEGDQARQLADEEQTKGDGHDPSCPSCQGIAADLAEHVAMIRARDRGASRVAA